MKNFTELKERMLLSIPADTVYITDFQKPGFKIPEGTYYIMKIVDVQLVEVKGLLRIMTLRCIVTGNVYEVSICGCSKYTSSFVELATFGRI